MRVIASPLQKAPKPSPCCTVLCQVDLARGRGSERGTNAQSAATKCIYLLDQSIWRMPQALPRPQQPGPITMLAHQALWTEPAHQVALSSDAGGLGGIPFYADAVRAGPALDSAAR